MKNLNAIRAIGLILLSVFANPVSAQTSTGLTFGYRSDAPPFSHVTEEGVVGYIAAICAEIAARLERENPEYAPITSISVDAAGRFKAIQGGDIDVLCGATTATRDRRSFIDFSIPLYFDGVTPLIRRENVSQFGVATDNRTTFEELATSIESSARSVAVLDNSTTAQFVERVIDPMVESRVEFSTVGGHEDGVAALLAGEIDIYFISAAIAQWYVRKNPEELYVGDAMYTHEPISIGIRHGDPDLRLAIDIAISDLIFDGMVFRAFEEHIGPVGDELRSFIISSALE